MLMLKKTSFLILLSLTSVAPPPALAQPSEQEVQSAMHRAVTFFREHASAGGGYIYQLSADLSRREGEGVVGPTTAWIQPPATPAVGLAYLQGYRQCGDPMLLDAAKETAKALVRGQLRSGGWDNRIEFAPADRAKYAYRVETANHKKKLRNTTTFDDDKSQSAIRFLMQLDQELGFDDPAIHEAVLYALDAVLKSQYDNGGWPQRFSEYPEPTGTDGLKASLPQEWSRTFPGSTYAGFFTLNDNTMADLIVTLLDAWDIYSDRRFLAAALRGGDFLVRAQLPEPQPGWAQQYNHQLQPAWARKFEPPSITGGESQGVMRTLMALYRRTAASADRADRFLDPIPPAIAYFRRSLLPDGRLARFYEIGSNRPLYFTKDYQLTYASDDMPTHYSFIVSSKLDSIERELEKLRSTPVAELWQPNRPARILRRSANLDARVAEVIGDLDERGAWVEPGRLRYHDDSDPTREVIRSRTFIENLGTLADWLGAKPD